MREGTHGKAATAKLPPLQMCWKILLLGEAVGMLFRCIFQTASCYGLGWKITKALYHKRFCKDHLVPTPSLYR